MTRRRGGPAWGLGPIGALFLLAGTVPFVSALVDSFFHDVYGSKAFAGLDNYRMLAQDRAFGLSALITLVWALSSTILSVSIGYCLATALHEAKRGFRALYLALLVPWGIPAFIAVPVWRMLIHGSGGESILSALFGIRVNLITDPLPSFLAALFVSAWMNAPAAVFVIYGALRKVPRRVVEAARIDGAGSAAISRHIYLPQVSGSILVIAALEFTKAFKEFNVPFLLTAGGPSLVGGITDRTIVGATTTLEVYLYDVFQSSEDYGLAAAYAAVLAGAICVLVALAFLARRAAGRGLSPKKQGLSPSRPVPRVPFTGPAADGAWAALRGTLAVLAAASSILAVYALLWTSFSGLSSNYVDAFFPRFFTARNYIEIFTRDEIWRPFLNTLGVSLAAAVLMPLIVMPAALFLRSARPSVKAAAFALAQAFGSAGGMHSLVPLYAIFRSLGMTDSYLPIVIVYLFHAAPFALFTTTAFLERLSPGLEEAAELEGAGPVARLLRITLPLALPAVATSAMIAFLAAWNGFLVPLLFLSDDAKYTIGVRLHAYVGSVASGAPQWNRFSAASIVNLLLIGAVFYRFRSPLSNADAAEHEE